VTYLLYDHLGRLYLHAITSTMLSIFFVLCMTLHAVAAGTLVVVKAIRLYVRAAWTPSAKSI
jgi:hypothetical protein